MSMIWISWLRAGAPRARRVLVVLACVGAVIVVLAFGSLTAEGETGSPSAVGGATCPSPNPPNELALVAGTPQSAQLGSVFASSLQVMLTNTDGCPLTTAVAGIPVTFTAPSTGAGGLFSASGSSTVTVGSDAAGMAAAPPFTANDTAGSYTLTALSAYGAVSFSLTNAEGSESSACGTASSAVPSTGLLRENAAGEPANLAVGVGASQSTLTGRRFPIRLAVTVTDAEKNPVAGVLVTFAAPERGPSGYFSILTNAVKSMRPRTSQLRHVQVRSDACGVALAPTFNADRRPGGYIVLASVQHVRAAFALVNEGRWR